MAEMIERSPWLSKQFSLVLGPGAIELDHLQADDNGFQVTTQVTDRSILLLDDTYTSGARAQSAASALTAAGGHVVAIAPAGRFIRPNPRYPKDGALIEEAKSLSFSYDYCCIGGHPLPPSKSSGI